MTEPRAPLPPQSPARVFWRQFRKSPLGIAGGALLALFYACALFAPFLAPYAADTVDRQRFYHPPQRVHFRDPGGRFHLAPFVYATTPGGAGDFRYPENPAQIEPLRFFVRGERYRLFGFLPADRHL
jgi:peptide/nickel transport system permease protein